MSADARSRFLHLLQSAASDGTLVKLTLGKSRSADPTLKNVFIRPVTLKAGPHLTFVWRHATRDITKNHPVPEALVQLETLIGREFLDAHLFTATVTAQLEGQPDGTARLREKAAEPSASTAPADHDRAKSRPIPAGAPWLQSLGVTNERGRPREGMADKFRQIEKFAELLSHLLAELGVTLDATEPGSTSPNDTPLSVVDMGSGKGYLTFAVAELLGSRATVLGVEARKELADLCNAVATQHGLVPRLRFTAGTISDSRLTAVDVLIALHACDTATDDALAKGIAAGAQLLVVSPCCQKELRRQLTPPAVLADALEHGIFQERQAEFVTDALRAQLLEWAGYRTKVFEFISTEHTAKNLMIAGIKDHPAGDEARAAHIRDFAAFYGIKTQALAQQLGFPLAQSANRE
ncbi:MAG: SAM-dependent methyltransferase [Opitutus sp.]